MRRNDEDGEEKKYIGNMRVILMRREGGRREGITGEGGGEGH